MEAIGYDSETLNIYRKALPKLSCGIDLKVPKEAGMLQSLSRLNGLSAHYIALYNLLVDSGLRLIEAIRVAREFESVERINGFYRVALGEFRGSKQAYYAYLIEPTYNQILAVRAELLNVKYSSRFPRNHGLIPPKYLRKFAFDKMVELEIPESVADFIEGRVPKRIGAKHYMVLRRQADRFYSKYAEYLSKIRKMVRHYAKFFYRGPTN
jgi:intergrase/recombinase